MCNNGSLAQDDDLWRWRLLCGPLLAALVITVTLAFAQPRVSPSPKHDPPGQLAASAVKELLDGRTDDHAFKSMMRERRKSLEGGDLLVQDSYPPWLAARLIRQAAEGHLFVGASDNISLRLTWDMGDDAFWYIGRVSAINPDGSKVVAGGPWVLWKHLGELVTPQGPEDKPWVAEYALSSVADGDVVEFDVYRLPRDSVDVVERLDPAAAIDADSAQLLLRLHLPVIVSDGQHLR
jgi:hypothetical protein